MVYNCDPGLQIVVLTRGDGDKNLILVLVTILSYSSDKHYVSKCSETTSNGIYSGPKNPYKYLSQDWREQEQNKRNEEDVEGRSDI